MIVSCPEILHAIDELESSGSFYWYRSGTS